MKNQQSETSTAQAKKRIDVKYLPMTCLVLGIIAVAFVIMWLTKFASASNRMSTPSEIAAQKVFQDKLNSAQEEFQQKIDSVTREAEHKSESFGN